jgi:hypothetical protein
MSWIYFKKTKQWYEKTSGLPILINNEAATEIYDDDSDVGPVDYIKCLCKKIRIRENGPDQLFWRKNKILKTKMSGRTLLLERRLRHIL